MADVIGSLDGIWQISDSLMADPFSYEFDVVGYKTWDSEEPHWGKPEGVAASDVEACYVKYTDASGVDPTSHYSWVHAIDVIDTWDDWYTDIEGDLSDHGYGLA